MTRIQKLEQEVRKLAPSELAAFRKWFQNYDSDQWDSRIERVVRVGLHYRALAVEIQEGLLWFWIGSHAEYDKLLNS